MSRHIGKEDLAMAARRLFATEDGQVILGFLIAKFGYVDKSTFDSDHATMAQNEGQRQVLQALNRMMTMPLGQANPADNEDYEDDQDRGF